MRARVALLLATACACAVPGCGGGSPAAPTAARPPLPPVRSSPAPGAGKALLRFVAAARRGDRAALWAGVTGETRRTHGRRQRVFAAGTARDLELGPGAMTGPVRLVLARRVGPARAVAAVAGARVEEGERVPYAWGAALVRSGGRWLVELDALTLGGLEPEAGAEVESPAELRVRAQGPANVRRLQLWVDGRPVAARADAPLPFALGLVTARRPFAPGLHLAVAYAETRLGAGAVAWPFVVVRR